MGRRTTAVSVAVWLSAFALVFVLFMVVDRLTRFGVAPLAAWHPRAGEGTLRFDRATRECAWYQDGTLYALASPMSGEGTWLVRGSHGVVDLGIARAHKTVVFEPIHEGQIGWELAGGVVTCNGSDALHVYRGAPCASHGAFLFVWSACEWWMHVERDAAWCVESVAGGASPACPVATMAPCFEMEAT